MKVKFLKGYKVDAPDGEQYEAGQVVELEEPSANHFISRGVAVQHVEPAPVKKKKTRKKKSADD